MPIQRPDFSQLVAHFTKDGYPCAGAGSGGIQGNALQRLISILNSKTIKATNMPWTNRVAVCFTECPFWSLIDHARAYSPYGVGFTKPHLFAAGGGPAIYLRPDLREKQSTFSSSCGQMKGLHPDLYAFVTPFIPVYSSQDYKDRHNHGKHVDYSHEREWRVPNNFTFEYSQVQFVILKSYEDMAQFPKQLKDNIGRGKFILMENYEKIEELWPTHKIGE